jgi:hypothetical protein
VLSYEKSPLFPTTKSIVSPVLRVRLSKKDAGLALSTKSLKILGLKQIYNSNNEQITPIGEQADEYAEWLKERMNLFVTLRSNFFASVSDTNIIFNIDEKANTLQQVERSKTFGGRACRSYSSKLLNLFAEWLGMPFPEDVKTIPTRCQFLSLLVRDAIIKGKKGIVWWTPEEWEIFNEIDNKKELMAKLKA